uniref:SOUL heme-binding protein n=1 Tax=Tetraselmis chuii TaxID=63592 RepID=A0A7S1ST44_9CHLO|mmetsp:Transcript_27653/g.49346  ORF Transcript_27653/g.49346 Transcript_27653/m.49346 type:complete len:221 (+) Transcript_27653:258-920(+)|eukprot:CAMPEP_0177773504 /NCGR_PEP_ID=MMETSP0491_2-20121128/12911_1 /TAXON_ID=63592 /ORGANISM="Tetraselmis chuii, Strain PLY429" /LENGTH=220 /DNA_ID=CAMNT_0019291625 /DNA_START=470 /DNA_END=1132 /DNA_ORIENTATION=+
MGQLLGKIDVEMPAHEVLSTPPGGFYEVRKYPPAVAVETPHSTGKDGRPDDGSSFNRLAKYIGVFGNPQNTKTEGEGGETIAMTAPVVTAGGSEQIAMTAPVVTAQDSDIHSGVMQFLLPSKFTMETAPKPTDPQVSLREIPARTLAVHTFSGWTNAKYVAEKETALMDALKKDKVEVCGKPFLLRYNPPWTLGPMRRNEVVVAVKYDSPQTGGADAASK